MSFFSSRLDFLASGQAVVTGVVRSPPPLLTFNFLSSIGFRNLTDRRIFHRALLSHAHAFSASQLVHKKMYLQIYMRMHSGGVQLVEAIYTKLEDNQERPVVLGGVPAPSATLKWDHFSLVPKNVSQTYVLNNVCSTYYLSLSLVGSPVLVCSYQS